MRYLKLTIQRNRRRIQLEQLLLLAVADRAAGAAVLLPGAAGAQPDGAGAMAGHRRPLEPGRADRRLDEHGLRRRRGLGVPAGPAGGGRAARRRSRPQDHCTIATTSAPRVPVLHDVEGGRRDELSAAALRPAAHGHSRRVARGAGGRRRGLALLHLSDAAAHDLHRPAQERLGGRRAADQPAMERAGGPRADRRRRRRRDRATSRSRRCVPSDRTVLAGAESRLGGDDPQRLAAHARAAPRRSSASTTSRPRSCCRRSRRTTRSRVPLSVPFPGLGAARALAPAPRRRAAGRQPALGRRPGQGLAVDPPGGWRAVVGAVRLRGRLPGRAAVDRHRRGGGLAGRGGPGPGFPLAAAGARRRARPGQRRRPDARAGRAARPARPRGHGPDDLHRGQARRRPLQRPALPARRPALAVSR